MCLALDCHVDSPVYLRLLRCGHVHSGGILARRGGDVVLVGSGGVCLTSTRLCEKRSPDPSAWAGLGEVRQD